MASFELGQNVTVCEPCRCNKWLFAAHENSTLFELDLGLDASSNETHGQLDHGSAPTKPAKTHISQPPATSTFHFHRGWLVFKSFDPLPSSDGCELGPRLALAAPL